MRGIRGGRGDEAPCGEKRVAGRKKRKEEEDWKERRRLRWERSSNEKGKGIMGRWEKNRMHGVGREGL